MISSISGKLTLKILSNLLSHMPTSTSLISMKPISEKKCPCNINLFLENKPKIRKLCLLMDSLNNSERADSNFQIISMKLWLNLYHLQGKESKRKFIKIKKNYGFPKTIDVLAKILKQCSKSWNSTKVAMTLPLSHKNLWPNNASYKKSKNTSVSSRAEYSDHSWFFRLKKKKICSCKLKWMPKPKKKTNITLLCK